MDAKVIGKYARLWDLMACKNDIEKFPRFLLDSANDVNFNERWETVYVDNNKDKNHFWGCILRSMDNDEYVVAYRGTDFATIEGNFYDFLIADGKTSIGLHSSQLDSAEYMFEYAKKNYNVNPDNLKVVGHSLGGALAQYVGIKNPDYTTLCFDPLGVKRVMENANFDFSKANFSNIYCYMSAIDVVGNLAPHCSKNIYFIDKPVNFIKDQERLHCLKNEFKTVKLICESFANIVKNYEINKEEKGKLNVTIPAALCKGVEQNFSIDPKDILFSKKSIFSYFIDNCLEQNLLEKLNVWTPLNWPKEAHLASIFYDGLKDENISVNNIYLN